MLEEKNHTTAPETRHGVNIGFIGIRLDSKTEMKSYNYIHNQYSLNSLVNYQHTGGEGVFIN